jgi:hypothetical protein
MNADEDYLFRLFEVSTEFPKMEVNALFDKQIDRLRRQVQQPELRKQLEKAKGFDWVGYIAASLRNASIPSHDVDSAVQSIVIKFLVQPGTLFQNVQGPILARFKVAVRNAVLNRMERHQRRRRWFPHVSPEDVEIAMHSTGDEEMIERFRAEIEKTLSPLALAIFDIRLDAGSTKSLIKSPVVGSPTAYQVKREVQRVKQLAQQFGDEEFQAMVQRAMDAEQETLAKRFGAVATA